MPQDPNAPQTNQSQYGYTPSLIMAVIFIALFTISFVIHTIQTFTKRAPKWMIVMSIGCALEAAGWGGRIWSRNAPAANGFMLQICCLIIAPTFYSGALYMLLGLLIGLVAPESSPLSAKWFKIVFIAGDIFSLVVQAVGGALASIANTDSGVKTGSDIMLAGIIIQLIVMVVYSVFGLYWGQRSFSAWRLAHKNLKTLVFGMAVCSIMIIIRGVYRTAELAGGFDGSLAHNQMTFLLDAIPVSIATYAINFCHPGRLLYYLQTAENLPPSYSGNSSTTAIAMGEVDSAKYGAGRV